MIIQSLMTIMIALLNEMHNLDIQNEPLSNIITEDLEILEHKNLIFTETFIENCSYIIQWLYLVQQTESNLYATPLLISQKS